VSLVLCCADGFIDVDGGSPTGSVASFVTGTSYDSAASLTRSTVLPRADILVLGGDLAYPHPSNDTYESRLFSPFEAALPPPSHVHPGRLVVQKPDLLNGPGSPARRTQHSGRRHVTAQSARTSDRLMAPIAAPFARNNCASEVSMS
jgi:hypothetical protein